MPNDNIERIIKKAAGETDGEKFESIGYEGYGPCGVAVLSVETLTDNRNRTAGDVRHYFLIKSCNWVPSAVFLLCLSKKECWL